MSEQYRGRFVVLLGGAVRDTLDEACSQRGTNASVVVRGLIETFLQRTDRWVDYTPLNMAATKNSRVDLKSARLTVLIEPKVKAALERACDEMDMTPSQVVRRLVREWLSQNAPVPHISLAPKPAPQRP